MTIPETFARQIGRLFDDEALRLRLAAAGRRVAESRYSWTFQAARLAGHYEALAAGTPPAVAAPGAGVDARAAAARS